MLSDFDWSIAKELHENEVSLVNGIWILLVIH